MSQQFINKFRRHLEKNFGFIKGKKLLIACSGGLDSMALLHLCAEARNKFPLSLYAMYVNHNLRDGCEAESRFVESVASSLEIPYYCGVIPKIFWNDEKKNIEARARERRYSLLVETAENNLIPFIATAHHKDDQVETLLMRILDRGTGIRGLAGIQALKIINDTSIIRPLLKISKTELSAFMSDKQWVDDPTNRNSDFKRNYYRNEIIPLLEQKLSIDFKDHLATLAENACADAVFMETAVYNFWQQFLVEGGYFISREKIAAYKDNFWKSALSYLYYSEKTHSLSAVSIHNLWQFMHNRGEGSTLYHPFCVEKTKNGVRFTKIVKKLS